MSLPQCMEHLPATSGALRALCLALASEPPAWHSSRRSSSGITQQPSVFCIERLSARCGNLSTGERGRRRSWPISRTEIAHVRPRGQDKLGNPSLDDSFFLQEKAPSQRSRLRYCRSRPSTPFPPATTPPLPTLQQSPPTP